MTTISSKIPTSGRLGKIVEKIREKEGEEVLGLIFNDYNSKASTVEKAEWIEKMVISLEKEITKEKAIAIFEECGRDSCTTGFQKRVKNLFDKSKTIEDFITKLSEAYKRTSFFELEDKHTMISGHNRCYLLIKSAKKDFVTETFCHFCVGHGKQFYESAFEKPVEIELMESVKTGGKSCKFRVKTPDLAK